MQVASLGLFSRIAALLGSNIPGCKTPTPYWLAWVLVSAVNLFLGVCMWREWDPDVDHSSWELALRRANAWWILTFPVSGFVVLPFMMAAFVVVPTWLLASALGRAAYRTACEVVSVAAGEHK